MNEALTMLQKAQELVRHSAVCSVQAYCGLCSSRCGEAVLSVLDGELRMSEQLKAIESFYSVQTQPEASEYEIRKFCSTK